MAERILFDYQYDKKLRLAAIEMLERAKQQELASRRIPIHLRDSQKTVLLVHPENVKERIEELTKKNIKFLLFSIIEIQSWDD